MRDQTRVSLEGLGGPFLGSFCLVVVVGGEESGGEGVEIEEEEGTGSSWIGQRWRGIFSGGRRTE